MQHSKIYKLPKADALTSNETPLSFQWLARRCLAPHGMRRSCLEHKTRRENRNSQQTKQKQRNSL